MNLGQVESQLAKFVGSRAPGIQYLTLNADGPLFEYCSGYADIRSQRPMQAATGLAAYSMSKTITAAGVMLLVQDGVLSLDDPIAPYVRLPYDSAITIRQLLSHTSGIPNPIPLRWVHPAALHDSFDEAAALQGVLGKHAKPAFRPGSKFRYSNIGYWLLGEIVERAAGQPFTRYIAERIFRPLGIPSSDLSYAIGDLNSYAQGYLEKYSLMNLAKRFLIDRELIGGYDGHWLRIQPHCVNGAAFGGLVGTCRGFGAFLTDQLRPRSILFADATRELFHAQQLTPSGSLIPMTPGWHVEQSGNTRIYFKEGGGGGFHCMMRVYRDAGIATVVMANSTAFDARACLNAADHFFY